MVNPYIEAKLYKRKGDLSKRWYVEFGAWNPYENSVEKKKVYCPAKFKTEKQREVWAKGVCDEINHGLRKGAVMVQEAKTPEAPPAELQLLPEMESVLAVLGKTLRKKSVITYNSAFTKFKSFIAWTNEPDNKVTPISTAVTVSSFKSTYSIVFRDYLITQLNNSPRTANNTVEHLNTIYKHMSDRKEVPVTPFKLKKLKEEVTTKNIAFSDVDRQKVESYMLEHEPELYLFTRMMYYAFIRPGELHQITLADVRLYEKYILIRGAVSKNGKTETVQIIPPLFEALKQVNIQDEKQFYYLFGKGLTPSKYMTAKEVAFRRHQKVLKHLGLLETGYTLYSWKHTGAVNAYRAGVGVKELQKLLRHSSVQITDIYLKSLGLRTDPNIQNYSW
jgi:integrase